VGHRVADQPVADRPVTDAEAVDESNGSPA
jgi:hypothetical protein